MASVPGLPCSVRVLIMRTERGRPGAEATSVVCQVPITRNGWVNDSVTIKFHHYYLSLSISKCFLHLAVSSCLPVGVEGAVYYLSLSIFLHLAVSSCLPVGVEGAVIVATLRLGPRLCTATFTNPASTRSLRYFQFPYQQAEM